MTTHKIDKKTTNDWHAFTYGSMLHQWVVQWILSKHLVVKVYIKFD